MSVPTPPSASDTPPTAADDRLETVGGPDATGSDATGSDATGSDATGPARVGRVTAGPSLGRLARGFDALRSRNYRLWWIGQLVSNTGTWMQSTAQAWLVLQLTDSPLAIGLVALFQFFPVMVLALVGGVIADRLPRYRLVLVTQTLAMLLAVVFGVLVGWGLIQLWQVYLLAFLGGLVNAIDTPVRQTFAVDLVDREHRANAVALNSMVFNASRIVGPALTGLLIGPVGIAAILYINAASFLAVLLGLLRMDTTRLDARAPGTSGSLAARLGEGLRYVRNTPEVLRVMILVGAIGTFGYNFSVTLPLIGGFITAANTLLQLRVPDELRGRVMSVYSLLFMGSTPVGGLLIGGAAHAFGVPKALLLCATLCLIGVGGALVYRSPGPLSP